MLSPTAAMPPLLVAACSLVFAAFVSPQGPTSPPAAPAEVLAPLGLKSATMQDLALPMVLGPSFRVAVVLGGTPRVLQLVAHDVRSPNFKLMVDDGVSLRQVPTPPSVTYRGNVEGVPGSLASAALLNGQLEAMVDIGRETWWIQPASQAIVGLPPQTHVVYRNDESLPLPACGVTAHADLGPAAIGPPSGALKEAELAIDATFEFYQRNGSNLTTTQNALTSIINSVDAIYVRDTQITYAVTQTIIRTTAGTYVNNSNLLTQFQNEWNQNQSGVQRDLAHMFAGLPPGGVIGIANLAVVCAKSAAYGVTWYYGGLNGRISIAAHEMGHNWSAIHCDNFNPCYIMCSVLNSCSGAQLLFEPLGINYITNFKNSRGCLSTPTGGAAPTLTNISPISVNSQQPVEVTLTGTLLDTATSVTLGSVNVPFFTVVNSSTLKFTPPSPFEINTHAVRVTNNNGPSNAMNLTVTGTHPSVLVTPFLHPRGFPIDYVVYTDNAWIAALFLSTSNTPSVLPGIVNLSIGASFTQLWHLVTMVADNTGYATVPITIPNSAPAFFPLYWQAVTFDGANVVLPFETSNAATVTTF